MDLFSDSFRFGYHALIYCFITAILYSQRIHFFEDGFITIPILTAIFAVCFSWVHAIVSYALGDGIPFSWQRVESDFILMPMADALYAMIAFSLPSLFIPKTRPRQTRLFSLKEKS